MDKNLNGSPLGIIPEASFEKYDIQLQPGDLIVLFTDGVIEAKNANGAIFSMDHVEQLANNQWESPADLVQAIIDAVIKFSQGTPQHDDITVLAIKWC